jgi:hypothetical protein
MDKEDPKESPKLVDNKDIEWTQNLYSTIQNNVDLQLENLIIKCDEPEYKTKILIIINSINAYSVNEEFELKSFVVKKKTKTILFCFKKNQSKIN